MESWQSRLNPRASRPLRMALGGLVWSAVGLLLLGMGGTWLAAASGLVRLELALPAAVVAVLAWRFGLSRVAERNLRRLQEGPERACVFGFQPPRSWLIVALMITMGSLLRHSALPRLWLAPVYLSMGGALLMSSPTQMIRACRAWR